MVMMPYFMLVVENALSIIAQHFYNGFEHFVVMMMRHHGMCQYHDIDQQDEQYGKASFHHHGYKVTKNSAKLVDALQNYEEVI